MMNHTLETLGDIKYYGVSKTVNAFRTDLSDIRKITIGDVKEGFSFTVGSKVNAGGNQIIISKILRDENSFFIFGEIMYLIYAKNTNGEEFLWNAISNMPLRIEFNLPIV